MRYLVSDQERSGPPVDCLPSPLPPRVGRSTSDALNRSGLLGRRLLDSLFRAKRRRLRPLVSGRGGGPDEADVTLACTESLEALIRPDCLICCSSKWPICTAVSAAIRSCIAVRLASPSRCRAVFLRATKPRPCAWIVTADRSMRSASAKTPHCIMSSARTCQRIVSGGECFSHPDQARQMGWPSRRRPRWIPAAPTSTAPGGPAPRAARAAAL